MRPLNQSSDRTELKIKHHYSKMKKIEITPKQLNAFKEMHAALKTIARDYQTPDQIRRNSEKQYGLDYEEALEMSYENIQSLAGIASKGVKFPKNEQS